MSDSLAITHHKFNPEKGILVLQLELTPKPVAFTRASLRRYRNVWIVEAFNEGDKVTQLVGAYEFTGFQLNGKWMDAEDLRRPSVRICCAEDGSSGVALRIKLEEKTLSRERERVKEAKKLEVAGKKSLDEEWKVYFEKIHLFEL